MLMKATKRMLVVTWNLLLGFISLWWFILSFAAAVNIDKKADMEIFQPLGWISLILMIITIFCSNVKIFNKYKRLNKYILVLQVLPYIIGLSVSIVIIYLS